MLDWTLFNGADWFIVVVLFVSVLISLLRGFTREAISLGGWVAAFIVANVFAAELASLLSRWISSVTGSYVVGYAVLFISTLLVARLVAHLARQMLRATGLSVLDRLMGTVFGFARGVIVVLVGAFLLQQVVPPQNLAWLDQSQLMPHIDMLAHWVQRMFAELGEDLGPSLQL